MKNVQTIISGKKGSLAEYNKLKPDSWFRMKHTSDEDEYPAYKVSNNYAVLFDDCGDYFIVKMEKNANYQLVENPAQTLEDAITIAELAEERDKYEKAFRKCLKDYNFVVSASGSRVSANDFLY